MLFQCIVIFSLQFSGKGDMDYILESVPFTNCAEEPRLHAIVQDLIEKGEVPEFKDFTEENEKKKLRRKRKVSTTFKYNILLKNNPHKCYLPIIRA